MKFSTKRSNLQVPIFSAFFSRYPHSFRYYFVTTILRASGNLKLAQELARHSNIQITQRYAHLSDDELDKGYYEIFEGKETR
jgi:site-specific recombinase XerC